MPLHSPSRGPSTKRGSVMALPPLEKRAREPSTLPDSPPKLRSGEEGGDRAGSEGRARPGEGFAPLWSARLAKRAAHAFSFAVTRAVNAEMLCVNAERLGDGFATPNVAGEGAIDPTERAEVGAGARAVGMVSHDEAGPPFI